METWSLSFLSDSLFLVPQLAHQRRQRQLAGGGGEGEEQWRWQTVWTAGLALVLAGALLDLASFAFAAVSLLAPLGAMTLLVNLVVAPWLVGERPSASDVANTLLIFAGAIVTVVFGSKDEPSYDLQALEALYFQPAVYAYAALFVAYVGGVLAALAHLDRRRVHSPAAERFRALAFPSVAGAFGSASVLFAKSVGQLALTTVQGANQFGHGETYALLVALLTAVGLQTALLNRGLALHAVLFVVPVYQAFWVVSSCAVGMVRGKCFPP